MQEGKEGLTYSCLNLDAHVLGHLYPPTDRPGDLVINVVVPKSSCSSQEPEKAAVRRPRLRASDVGSHCEVSVVRPWVSTGEKFPGFRTLCTMAATDQWCSASLRVRVAEYSYCSNVRIIPLVHG
jgi:hypothetical protein